MADRISLPPPALPWDRPDPYVIRIEVQPEQIDLLGHTNNVHYLSWLQDCAWAHSVARGVDGDHMVRIDRAMAVRESRMHYLGATFAGDVLWVGDWITACDGRLRAQRSFQIIRASDQATVLRAVIDYVCIAIGSGRPTRMPEPFARAYADDVRAEP
ncbi:MAG: thioesterase family protein [Pseudomonadales bacterium]|nr:thioesterase family protein [Pseudomonadales bacterium]